MGIGKAGKKGPPESHCRISQAVLGLGGETRSGQLICKGRGLLPVFVFPDPGLALRAMRLSVIPATGLS